MAYANRTEAVVDVPEIQSVLPKYLQIAQHLRDQIVRGDLPAGAEVPSERQLAESWNVARPTAARALETLRRDGLVASRQGAGTYVLGSEAPRRASYRYYRFKERGAQYGPDEEMRSVSASIVVAPDYVRAALRLSPKSKATMRRRLIFRGNDPAEISTSWWPAELAKIAPKLLEPVTLGGIGSVRYVESVTGRIATYAHDRVGARLAAADEAQDLALGEDPEAVVRAQGLERALDVATGLAYALGLVAWLAYVRTTRGDARRSLVAITACALVAPIFLRLDDLGLPRVWERTAYVLVASLFVALQCAMLWYLAKSVGRQTQEDVDARLGRSHAKSAASSTSEVH